MSLSKQAALFLTAFFLLMSLPALADALAPLSGGGSSSSAIVVNNPPGTTPPDNSWMATGCARTNTCGGTTPAIQQIKAATGNHIVQTANGISLFVMSDAVVGIYGLKGNLVQRQSYASGEYNIPLGSLPKGMYIVKVSFDNHSSDKVLRVSVK